MGTANSINEIIKVNEEDGQDISKKLTEISKKTWRRPNDMYRPYVGLKVSPTKTVNVQMGLSKELAVETAINQIQTKTDAPAASSQ